MANPTIVLPQNLSSRQWESWHSIWGILQQKTEHHALKIAGVAGKSTNLADVIFILLLRHYV